jgi:mannitol/fructose-specific phosphotransferase system IIA component (Ntr-type)
MKLVDYTTEAALLPRLACDDLGEAVGRVAEGMARGGLVTDAQRFTGDVLVREREGGTALPEGLALPHARTSTAPAVRLGVATLARPVSAHDSEGAERAVDVVVVLAGPPGDPRGMLRVLARLARQVRAGTLLDRLRLAATPQAMRDVLAGLEAARGS